jgi:dUTP pyrophosphatase
MSITEIETVLLSEGASLPKRAHDDDAAADLYCTEPVDLGPGERVIVPTGVAVALPVGTAGIIWPRSGLAAKHGLQVLGGLIDPGYRGEIKVILHNSDKVNAFHADAGERIAQFLLVPYEAPVFRLVASLPEPEDGRGAGGFGSSGTR